MADCTVSPPEASAIAELSLAYSGYLLKSRLVTIATMSLHKPSPVSVREGDFASLFNFLPIGAFRSTVSGGMVRANPALMAMNGYAEESVMLEAVNRANSDWYLAPGRRAEFVEKLRRDGFVRGFISEVQRHGDGQRLWINENAHEVRNADGELLYFEGTVEDITDRMRMQESLRQNAEQLRLITSQIPGMVYVLHLSPDGKRSYRYVSPGIRDIYGLDPEAVLQDAQLVVRYRHPDDVHLLEQDLKELAATPKPLGGEFRIVLPDGEIRWLLRRSSVVASDESGQLRVGVLLDVTGRKEAEAALSDSEALWRLAMESAGDGVWDWNLVSGEEFVSHRIKSMFGYDEGDLLNLAEDLDARTHPDDVAQMKRDRNDHFEGRTPLYRNEHRVRCKDGNWKWVLSRGMVIARDELQRPLRMVGTHTDITDLKTAEAQHRLLEAQLREAQKLEAIGTLAGGVAHDFNNLLAVILGNLTLAREDVGPDHPAQESLNEINRASVRARHLVQQILAFSRRQTQELKQQVMQPLVEETLIMMRALLPMGVQQLSNMSAEPLLVHADATQLQQVLMNLCTNAWQSMDGRSGNIHVGLSAVVVDAGLAYQLGGVAPGDYVCLSVADDGPGMEKATQHRIFEPFFTTKAPGDGTGLGLAVVHGIVKTHLGAISVQSEPGKGTRFDVYLPRLSAAVSDGSNTDLTKPLALAEAIKGRHVVYIDDYEAMVFLVGRLLRKRGYEVSTFTSGEDAMAWLRDDAGKVDIVVTDQNMPGISGIEVAAQVKRLRPGLRTVLITGHVSEDLLAQAAEVGVHEVMGKQDSMAELGEAIGELLDTLVP
jgi:PAS domain S-box-containing protein